MAKYFTYIAAILLVLAGLITSCQKTDDITDNEIAVSTGSISGKYSPVGAAASIVTFKNSVNERAVAELDSSNGFNITNLQAGDYKILFTPMPGFIAPDSVWVTINAGENFDIGTVLFRKTDSSETGTFGSISGKISPVTAASAVSVIRIFTTTPYSVTPDTNGNFKINNLAAGEYTVSFTAALGFTAPNPRGATVSAGKNTDVGSINFSPIAVVKKSIDTIPGTVFVSSDQMTNDFITRANADSAIVLTGHLYMTTKVMTAELVSALNKIIAIKGSLMITNIPYASLTFKELKELGQFYLLSAPALTNVDLSALQTVTSGFSLIECPALTNLKVGALNQFAGSLTLHSTGFRDLTTFNSATYKPFSFEIQNNPQLTSLIGLNFASDSMYNCTITYNPLLTSLDGMQGVKRFKNETIISNNTALQTLTGLNNITVAKHLTLTNNSQLNAVCGAKQLINLLKDAPTYQVRRTNQLTGQVTYLTMQPLVASSNGNYATRAELVTAIGQCP